MKKNKKNAIKIIIEAAKNYETFLKDRQFLIVYLEKGTQKHVEVEFRDMHFLHLTGIKCKLTAQRFYEACLNGKLAEDDIDLGNGGKVEQKLQVLPYLSDLLYHNCMIGEFINSGVMIRADYFVGDTREILSVGFRCGKNVDFPVTLYKGEIRKLTSPTNKILAIFRRTYPDKTYKETTYVSKGIDIKALNVPGVIVETEDPS